MKEKEKHIQKALEKRGMISRKVKTLIENMPETGRTGILVSIIELALKDRSQNESGK